jgi:hypothetical protein
LLLLLLEQLMLLLLLALVVVVNDGGLVLGDFVVLGALLKFILWNQIFPRFTDIT